MREAWPNVTLRSDADGNGELLVGTTIPVRVWVGLAGLSPEEVAVEVAAGPPAPDGTPHKPALVAAQYVGDDGSEARFEAAVPCTTSGPLALAVRIRPRNPAAVNSLSPLLLTWE